MRARTRPSAALALLGVVVGALAVPPAGAQTAQPAPPRTTDAAAAQPPPTTALDDDVVAGISADLSGVRVTGRAAVAAQEVFEAAGAALDATIRERTALQRELFELRARDAQLTARIAEETDTRKDAAERFVVARQQMQAAAISTYMTSADMDELTAVVDFDATVEVGQVSTYGETVRDDRLRVAEEATEAYRAASEALDRTQVERGEVRSRQHTVRNDLLAMLALEEAQTAELAAAEAERDRTRATATVEGADFSLVALDAYWRAAGGEAECGIEWWMLAGISRVEGRHGTYGGTELLANGDNSRRIIGIALTGSGGTAAIRDSDGGALDGDAVHDRAVGPMQFIPGTWRRFARDGDGDGDEDPQNIYDATAAAAAYLCHGRRVDTEAGLRAGYFSYNHSLAYVDAVLRHAYGYREVRIPDPLPAPGAN